MHEITLRWGPGSSERVLSLRPGATDFEMPAERGDTSLLVHARGDVLESYHGREYQSLSTLETELRAKAEDKSFLATGLSLATFCLQSLSGVALGVAFGAGAPVLPLALGLLATVAISAAGHSVAKGVRQSAEQLLDQSHAVARVDAASFAVDTEKTPSNFISWRLNDEARPAPRSTSRHSWEPQRF